MRANTSGAAGGRKSVAQRGRMSRHDRGLSSCPSGFLYPDGVPELYRP